MNIKENLSENADAMTCEDCLKGTRVEIEGFFNYLDCDENNLINAENIYYGMKNMKGFNHEKNNYYYGKFFCHQYYGTFFSVFRYVRFLIRDVSWYV